MDGMGMTVKQLMRAPNDAVASARSGRPVHITRYGRPDVTIVRTTDYEHGEQAQAYMRGLLRLVREGADCDQISAFGEMLAELADAGWLIGDDVDKLPAATETTQ